VPVTEEEVVVEKRPVAKEEVRIRKDVVEDTEVVEEDVRKEEVDVDDQTERQPQSVRHLPTLDAIDRVERARVRWVGYRARPFAREPDPHGSKRVPIRFLLLLWSRTRPPCRRSRTPPDRAHPGTVGSEAQTHAARNKEEDLSALERRISAIASSGT
jgi:hypothetical protein